MAKVEPIIVSYSELDTYRQCPLKHFVTYGQRWTKPPKPDGALAKGSLWHKVLELHYGMIKAVQDEDGNYGKVPEYQVQPLLAAIRKEVNKLLRDPRTGEQSDVQILIEWMYEGYVEQYGVDPQWRIMAVEHQIITPLRDERGRRTRYHLKAKMDLLIRDRNGSLWVVDHKSGKDLPKQMDLEIDDQFGLYTWSMNEVGRPVLGSIHSANRTQRNVSFMALDTRMSRTYLNRGKTELRNIALDAYEVARAAHPPKGTRRARYSSPDPRQCGWKCDIKEPHLLARQGRDLSQVLTEYGFHIDKTRH